MGVAGILLSLGLLMYLAYRGINVLVLAPLLSLLAAVMGGDPRMLAIYTQVFMISLGGFVAKYFPLFLLGAIFGRLMSDSGSAASIARSIVARLGPSQALLAIVLACGILTYGGVSVFVVVFAAYPVAVELFRAANTPKRLIPGAIILGGATFTLSGMPGTPSIQNAIPMPFFGTDTFAAPGLGSVAGLVMLILGMWWLNGRARRAVAAGEGYGDHPHDLDLSPSPHQPPLMIALVPLVIVLLVNLVMTWWVIPAMDLAYLAEPRFGGVGVNDVRGIWALVASLGLAILVAIALHWPRWRDLKGSVNQGTMSSLLPIFNTASEIGYGAVIASLAAFATVQAAVMAISTNVLVSEAVAVNIMAGITGSAAGGLSLALGMLGKTYAEAGAAAGISPELLHRVAAIASGGLDSLPHNGAVITLLGICRLSHRESYLDIFMVSVVGPLAALAVVLVLGSTVGAF
ncbi:MAG: Na+/H+ antiporter NhaC family protein [Acidobacteriota bacterium]|nr:Na+/H+ antiporter NhaC family protein [Acidobacteriota bacterium]